MTTAHPWSPPMTSTAIRIGNGDLRSRTAHRHARRSAGVDRQYLAALVVTACRTDPVRDVRLGALRTFADLRELQHAVVSTAHAHPALRRFTFWNAHKIRITISVCLIRSTPTLVTPPRRRLHGPVAIRLS